MQGKNDATGIIEQCYIDNTGTGTITVKNGMVGGVTGYNKGTITMSGDKSTEALMKNVSKVSELLANAKAQKLSADSTWVKWADWTDVEKLSYNGGSKSVAADRTMQIIVSSNGNLGGVAGYNAPTGELNRCVSGRAASQQVGRHRCRHRRYCRHERERKGLVLSAQPGVCRPPAEQ